MLYLVFWWGWEWGVSLILQYAYLQHNMTAIATMCASKQCQLAWICRICQTQSHCYKVRKAIDSRCLMTLIYWPANGYRSRWFVKLVACHFSKRATFVCWFNSLIRSDNLLRRKKAKGGTYTVEWSTTLKKYVMGIVKLWKWKDLYDCILIHNKTDAN